MLRNFSYKIKKWSMYANLGFVKEQTPAVVIKLVTD